MGEVLTHSECDVSRWRKGPYATQHPYAQPHDLLGFAPSWECENQLSPQTYEPVPNVYPFFR